MKELEQGKYYIFKERDKKFPSVRKGTILGKTKTTVLIRFENSSTSIRYETNDFLEKWKVIEEIETNYDEVFNKLNNGKTI